MGWEYRKFDEVDDRHDLQAHMDRGWEPYAVIVVPEMRVDDYDPSGLRKVETPVRYHYLKKFVKTP